MPGTDGPVTSAVLHLQGLWLHDPIDPAGTAVNLRYGRAGRSSTTELLSQDSYYAGRTYPVVDYGPYVSETLRVTGIIPHGPDWADALEALRARALSRTALVVRDNRGRAFTGSLSGLDEADQPYGTQVTLTVTKRGDA